MENNTTETPDGPAIPCTALFDIFCDESYYGMWAVRMKGETHWGRCYHLPSSEEAYGLAEELGDHKRAVKGLQSENAGLKIENAENARTVSLLLEESESLADENEKMRLLIARAMEYGVNGSRCYSASEACRTGEAMRDILSNAEAHGRRSRTVQPLVGSSGSEGQA